MLCGLLPAFSAYGTPVEAVVSLLERVPMAQLARDVTDPASSRYRDYYSPEEIRARAGPTDGDFATLLTTLSDLELKVISVSKSHLSLTVSGEPAALAALRASTGIASAARSA